MIQYRLDHDLNQMALLKLEESIYPLVNLINDFVEESNSIEEVLSKIEEDIPFEIMTWLRHGYVVPTNEIWIRLINQVSAHCTMIVEVKSIYRDYQLKRILE